MTKHDPNEAIRLMEREPVAKSDYKTKDSAWVNPKVPASEKTLRIKFKKLSPTATLPTAIREGDIGFDVYCDEDFVLMPGSVKKVKTNIQLADMPTMDNDRNRIFFKIEGRSGLSAKGIFPTGGIVDSSYRGEVGVVLNMVSNPPAPGNDGVHFSKGDRIAQLVFYKVATMGEVVIEETDVVTDSVRGAQGFGSSGK
jgi:dUTP pyrophosphatase